MATSEKDRLGDKLRDVERGREDHYFAERDRKLIEEQKLAREHGTDKTALNRCPKCGEQLVERTLHGVTVDTCPTCEGMWVAKGELEAIATRENEGWMARWLRYEFENKKKS